MIFSNSINNLGTNARGKFVAQTMSLFDPVPPAEVKKSQLCTRPALVRGSDGKKKVYISLKITIFTQKLPFLPFSHFNALLFM